MRIGSGDEIAGDGTERGGRRMVGGICMPGSLPSAHRLKAVVTVFIVGALLAGCATDALKLAPERPDRPWQPEGSGMAPVGATPDTPVETQPLSFSVPPVAEAAEVPQGPVIDPAAVYGLPELIDLAQQQNPDTRLAWNTARQAALAVGVVEATFLPMLSANVLAGWQKTRTPIGLLGADFNIDTEVHGAVPALALEWLLFDFGQRRALAEGARHNAYAANVLFNATHQRIIHQVATAFYQYSAARQRRVNAVQAHAKSKVVAEAVEARQRGGVATVLELAQARQHVAQTALRVVDAEGLEQNAYQALLAAVGLPPFTRMEVRELPERRLPPADTGLTDDAIRMALASRPDVLASLAATRAAASGVEAAEAEFMPKVFLGAVAAHRKTDFDVRGLPGLSQQTSSASVLLGVTIPLYDGGLRAARLSAARTEAAKAEDIFRQTQKVAMREIIAAENALRTALASYHAADELVRTTQVTYDAALDAYRHGVGTVQAATLALSALLDAGQARADAQAASYTAAATLAFALGGLTSPERLPGER